MKKKILLNMGSFLLATTSTMVVISCGPKEEKQNPKVNKKNPNLEGNKEKKVKSFEKYKGSSNFGTLLKGSLNKILDEKFKKLILTNIDKILEGGIGNVEDADIEKILKSFNVSDSLSGVILKLLKPDLLERVFVKGFGDIQEKSTYDAKKEAVKTFVESVLDAPKEGDIFTRDLLTKLLIGFENQEDISQTINNLLEKADLGSLNILRNPNMNISKVINNAIKYEDNSLVILRKGLLGLNPEEIDHFLKWLPSITGLISGVTRDKIDIPQIMKDALEIYSYSNALETNDKKINDLGTGDKKIAESIYSLINGGLKGLKGKNNTDDFITFIEFVSGQKENPKKSKTNLAPSASLESTNKKPTTIRIVANLLINNSESLYSFLKNGFSQDDWKELDKKLLGLISYLIPLFVGK